MKVFAIQGFSNNYSAKKAEGISFGSLAVAKKVPKNFDGSVQRALKTGAARELQYLHGRKVIDAFTGKNGVLSLREYDLFGQLGSLFQQKANGFQKIKLFRPDKTLEKQVTKFANGFSSFLECYADGTRKRKFSAYKDGTRQAEYYVKNVLRRKVLFFTDNSVDKYNYDKNGKLINLITEETFLDGTFIKTFYTANMKPYWQIEKTPSGITKFHSFHANGEVKKTMEKHPGGIEYEFHYSNKGDLKKSVGHEPQEGDSYIYYKDQKSEMMLENTPEGESIEHFYDAKGNEISSVEVREDGIFFNKFDEEGRLTEDSDDFEKAVAAEKKYYQDRSRELLKAKMLSFNEIIENVEEYFKHSKN